MASSISLFGEGTFEEQIRELVDFLARGLADDARIAFIKPFSEGLVTESHIKGFDESPERRKKVISLLLPEVKGLGQGSEREIEGFFNLVFAHVTSLYPEPAALKERITPLLTTISSSTPESQGLKYRILTNLFNALPRTSSLRYDTYTALLSFASSNKDIELLQISKPAVDTWLSEWDVSAEQKEKLLKTIGDAFSSAGKPASAYPFYLTGAQSHPTSSSALDVVVCAFKLPYTTDLSGLNQIPNLPSLLGNSPFATALATFRSGDLTAWDSWRGANAAAIDGAGLNAVELDRKIRFMALTTLASKHLGEDLPYGDIATTLKLKDSAVEAWVIDAIRAKILAGRLSQSTQTFHVTRTTTSSYTPFSSPAQWSALEAKLTSWRAGLVGVLDVVSAAKAQAEKSSGGGLGGASGANAGNAEEGAEGEKKTGEKVPVAHGDLAPAGGAAA
ncbi:hypothetical protein DL93DRAFT_2087891 [Clavulina sp. PMI_390]|nr:hypothetical protein DL93DRAFT_2087891 [Clavulina sp. PMI_390]